MMFCCCAKSRKDEDEDSLGDYESRLRSIKYILLEFTKEESNFKMKNINHVDLMSKLFEWSNEFRIPRKELHEELRHFSKINLNAVKYFLEQDYFFTDNTCQYFDFLRVICFTLLYGGGTDLEKAKFLFSIAQNKDINSISKTSREIREILEIMTIIPTITVSEVLLHQRRFSADSEEEFEDLRRLYLSNHNIISEFISEIISTYLFPTEDLQYLNKQNYLLKME